MYMFRSCLGFCAHLLGGGGQVLRGSCRVGMLVLGFSSEPFFCSRFGFMTWTMTCTFSRAQAWVISRHVCFGGAYGLCGCQKGRRAAERPVLSLLFAYGNFQLEICGIPLLQARSKFEFPTWRRDPEFVAKTPPAPKPSSADVYPCLIEDDGDELTVAEKELRSAKRKYEQLQYHYDRAVKERTAKPMPTKPMPIQQPQGSKVPVTVESKPEPPPAPDAGPRPLPQACQVCLLQLLAPSQAKYPGNKASADEATPKVASGEATQETPPRGVPLSAFRGFMRAPPQLGGDLTFPSFIAN